MKHYIKQVNSHIDSQGWSIWWCRGALVCEYFTRWIGSYDGERWSAKCTLEEAEQLAEKFLDDVAYMKYCMECRYEYPYNPKFTFRRKGRKIC